MPQRARSRSATWSAPTCPSAARRCSRSAASATSWAGSARSRPAARRPTSASASASAGPRARSVYDPAAAVDHFVPRPRAQLRLLLLALPRRGALEGDPRRPGRQRRPASPPSAPTCAAPCRCGFLRGLGDAAPRRPRRPRAGGGDRLRPAATTAGYLGARREATQARHGGASAPTTRRRRRAAGADGDPAQPAGPGRGRAPRDGSRAGGSPPPAPTVEVLCTEPGGPAVASEVRDGRARSAPSAPGRPSRDWCLAPRLWREMARQPWDVVHVQCYHTLVAAAGDAAGADPAASPTSSPSTAAATPRSFATAPARLQRRLLRPLLRRAARLVAVARFEIDEYGGELRLPPERFALIPNGTDLAFSRRGAAGAATAPPTLASIGRLERYKGHHRVLAAFPEVLEQRARGPAADRRHRPLRGGAAPAGGRARASTDSVEFTSRPADQPAAMAELLRRGLAGRPDERVRDATRWSRWRRRRRGAACSSPTPAASPSSPTTASPAAIPLDDEPRQIGRGGDRGAGRNRRRRHAPKLTSWDECAAALLELYGSVLKTEWPSSNQTSGAPKPSGRTSGSRGSK